MQPEVRSQRSEVGSQEPALRPQTSDIGLPRPLLLAGPTAVGKSEVALLLAERLGGEIISVDSMQVYRGLDIGTAKPSLKERQRVPHHLIDVVDLTESFDAAQFARLAHQAVKDIQARGRVPILCGGTGFYFQAFLEGLGDAPPADAALRAELQAIPLPELLRELEQRDPVAFQQIDRQNPRRVIRAVEVIRLTGKPFSEQRARWGEATDEPQLKTSGSRGRSPHQLCAFGLSRAVNDLRSRIDARVDAMFQQGLVEETKRLLERGLAENKSAMQSLGYRQVVEHLRGSPRGISASHASDRACGAIPRGERSLAETVELVKVRTRQFAKRQMTWFRLQAKLTSCF